MRGVTNFDCLKRQENRLFWIFNILERQDEYCGNPFGDWRPCNDVPHASFHVPIATIVSWSKLSSLEVPGEAQSPAYGGFYCMMWRRSDRGCTETFSIRNDLRLKPFPAESDGLWLTRVCMIQSVWKIVCWGWNETSEFLKGSGLGSLGSLTYGYRILGSTIDSRGGGKGSFPVLGEYG